VAGLLGIAGVGAFLVSLRSAGLDPTRHSFDASCWVLILWLGAHVGTGVIMHLYCAARSLAGRMTPRHDADLQNVTLYWHFMALTAATTWALFVLFPLATGGAP
jgi:cytochrome c oxidase subunit I+III